MLIEEKSWKSRTINNVSKDREDWAAEAGHHIQIMQQE